jgi:choline dehydrogenase-like flavoprotein
MEYDYIVGSGFGGSESSALRLSKKRVCVVVIEKGNGFKQKIFPKPTEILKNGFGCLVLFFLVS